MVAVGSDSVELTADQCVFLAFYIFAFGGLVCDERVLIFS
jgi:hypothetical protein